MSFSVFEKIDPSCQNGSMEKAKNIPYHQRPYASIAERTLVDISIYSPRPQIAGTGHSHSKISIHSPRAGRDCRYPNAPLIAQISIHSPHTGRDLLIASAIAPCAEHFNPLSPHGGETASYIRAQPPQLFQSTLPAWGETDSFNCNIVIADISIHSPRMGRDGASAPGIVPSAHFNPLSPHGERRIPLTVISSSPTFQSTLPAWGETAPLRPVSFRAPISIHSPRMGETSMVGVPSMDAIFQSTLPHGERRRSRWSAPWPKGFNPLSPHGRGRPPSPCSPQPWPYFNPSPRMGRDILWKEWKKEHEISIHSPRMGRDHRAGGRRAMPQFQSTPRMGRDRLECQTMPPGKFQSTLPAWGETAGIRGKQMPLEDFNPLSPHGERRRKATMSPFEILFQSTLPAWGETSSCSCFSPWWADFNPLSPHGERRRLPQ